MNDDWIDVILVTVAAAMQNDLVVNSAAIGLAVAMIIYSLVHGWRYLQWFIVHGDWSRRR